MSDATPVDPNMSELDIVKKGERTFLHDISNDVVVAQGMCAYVLRKLKDNKPLEDKDIERLEKTVDAIGKMTRKIKDRRATLIGPSDVII